MKTAMMTGHVTRFGDLEFALRLIKELGFEAVDLTMYDTLVVLLFVIVSYLLVT